MAIVVAVLQDIPSAYFAAEEFVKSSVGDEPTAAQACASSAGSLGCDERNRKLHQTTPGLTGEYMQNLEGSAPTKNQALAATQQFALAQTH